MCPGSSVGIATELGGWTVWSRIPVGTRFFRPSIPALGPTHPPDEPLRLTELRAGRSGIESRWRRYFSPTQPPVKWVPGLSRG